MRVSHVQFQIVITVSGVRAIWANFVLDPIVYPFDMRLQLVICDESFSALWTWIWFDFLPGPSQSTSPFQVLLQALENTSTNFARFQHFTCVLSLPVGLHVSQKGCCIITMRTLLNVFFFVSSSNVNG